MRKQRWCGALLALALVVTLLPTAAFAADYGTAENPILISSVQELEDFRDRVNDREPSLCAKLTADIVLNDGTFNENGAYTKGNSGKDAEQWKPIAQAEINSQGSLEATPYTGTFDGGGHTIWGLYVQNSGSSQGDPIGLFGHVQGATIKNLTVTGYVKGNQCVGGLVGRADGSSTIQNCINRCTVTGADWLGGLVGYTENGPVIQSCANLGRVVGKQTAGGILGHVSNGVTIQDCANLGSVRATDYNASAGGIVCYIRWNSTMESCYNVGEVAGISVGSLAGTVGWSREGDGPYKTASISNCYYLETLNEKAFGQKNYFNGDTSGWGKSANEFADGSVLALLLDSRAESPWADTCQSVTVGNTSMMLPWFTHPGNEHTAETGDCTSGIKCACGYEMYPAKANHSYPDNWAAVRPGSTHSKKCQNDGCGVTKSESCSGGTATCKEPATCKVCGKKYGEPDPNRHENLKHVDAKAATTTAEGNIEYWHCTGCHKYYKNAAATDGITQEDTVTAKLPSSSGGSGGSSYTPSYSVSVSEAEHGSVTVSPRYAEKGDTVTITVTPDKGYTLETLTVTDASGKELPLTDKGDGKYTFTQPSSKVTVKATFMDDNTMLNFFVDVKSSDYFYDAVLWAAQKGITSGTDDVHFSPNQPCTRAQIVTFLWRAAGSPVVNYAMSMDDVNESSYYAEAVRWALSEGITTGAGERSFSPDATCTRAQAVTFLARALNAKASGKAEFGDVPSGSYYADAVAWAAESGVTTGTSADAFSPDDVCTRGQIVTFLWRAYSK